MAQRRTKQAAAPASDDVYTMAEAARLKGVSYHTVSRAVRRGKLPSQRLGRMALITAPDLQAWQPMRERAPKKYRRREPDATAVPALIDLASGERVNLAGQLALLIETNHELVRGAGLSQFLAFLAERFAQALGLTRFELWTIEATTGQLRRRALIGSPLYADNTEPALASEPGLGQWLATEQATLYDGGAVGSMANSPTTLLVAPLRFGAEVVGMAIGDRGGARLALSSPQLQLAQALANQAAIALELERGRSATGDDGSAAR